MQTLKYVIGADRRALVKDVQDFKIDFSGVKNWLQARQYEDGMRYVFVDVTNEDGTPFDLTGCNVVFEGLLPDGTHRIMDAKHSVIIDPTNGQFRFDFPKQAFSLAGSYKQAFFRIMRDGSSVTTLEFSLEVLADKVISGIVPSDYLTPFEDLYAKLSDILANADGEVKTKIQEWQTQINQLITNLNGDYASIQLLVTGLQSQLNDIAQKIKDGNIVTAKDLTDFENQINNILYQQIDVDPTIDIGESLPDSLRKQLDVFKNQIPQSNFNVAIISDSHYDDRLTRAINPYIRGDVYSRSEDSFKHETAFNYLSDSVDVLIANGDDTNGFNESIERTKRELSAYSNKILTGTDDTDRYCILGNHDDGSGQKGNSSTLDSVVSDDELKEMFKTRDCINGEIRDGDSLYFYKDYEDKKIRLIGLNSLDDPDTLNSDGTIKYIKWLVHNYSQQQVNWLAHTALMNIPAGFQVLVVAHTPLIMDTVTDGYDAWNHRIVRSLLEAVKEGTPCSAVSDDGTPDDLKVSVDADYTGQGARSVIGFISGHVHAEKIWKWPKFTMTSVTCDVNDDASIVYDNPNSMAFTVYSIDTINRKVELYGFGRATHRSYSY